MPDQDYLAGSILSQPLQVGAAQGMPQASPLQQQQATPQQFYNGAADLGGMVTPATVAGAFPSPSDQVIKLSQLRINDAQDRMNKRRVKQMADEKYAEEHPHLNALSNILKSRNLTAGYLRSTANQEMLNYKIKEAQDNQDFKDILEASKTVAQTTDPDMLKFALGAMKDKAAVGKDLQQGINSEGEPELRKAQAYQAMMSGNYSQAEALGLPIKNQNEADKNTIEANKALIDYHLKLKEFNRNVNKDTYKQMQDSLQNYYKVLDINTKRAEVNQKGAQAASEQMASPDKRKLVPKYAGYNPGSPLPMLQPPPPPNTEGPAYPTDSPQAQTALKQLGNIFIRPSIQARPAPTPSGFEAPPAVPPPPPVQTASLVGPQSAPPRSGAAITPTQAAGQRIVPPAPPPNTVAPNAGSAQPQLSASDIPVPISAQTAYQSLPPGFKHLGEAMIATFKGRVAAGYPEAKELASMVQAMNKLTGKK